MFRYQRWAHNESISKNIDVLDQKKPEAIFHRDEKRLVIKSKENVFKET